jgi:hypothetical protein
MRKATGLTLAVLTFVAPSIGARPAGAQPPCAESWATEGLHLAGRVGDSDVRAYLDTGYPARAENGVSGVFFFPQAWVPGKGPVFGLDGTLTDDCRMRLTDSRGTEEGTWHLHFVTGVRLEGTRDSAAGGSAAVSLRASGPTDCSAGGVWRTFSSPAWPITFEYPASWQLAEEGDSIILECPDAGRLAWGGGSILLALGAGREDVVAEDGRRGARIDRVRHLWR